MNSILENLQQFYPLLPLNKEEDFIIGRELNTTLLQSLYPINEYSPVFTIKNSEKIKDITEVYEDEVELDPNYRHFQYTVNEEVKKSGSPKTLVFQGSYMNGKGAKFLQNSLGEYIAVHDYQNVINFDYYFNLFEPDCVIFEVAEYTLTDAYFSSENMKAMELNPLLESFNNVTEVSKDIRLLDVDTEEGNEIIKIKISNITDAEYAYIDIDGRIYDLRYSDDGNCYEVSILKERMGNIDNITLIKDDIKEIYSGIPAA